MFVHEMIENTSKNACIRENPFSRYLYFLLDHDLMHACMLRFCMHGMRNMSK